MRLIHFSYKEANWTFEPFLPLKEVSLLYNRNAVGKLKAMEAINFTINYILQAASIDNNNGFSSSLTFEDEGLTINYSFSISEGEVTAEELGVANQDPFLRRDKNNAWLQGEIINPPANKLTLHVRRDTKQYPHIEKIMLWAEHAYGHCFNENNRKHSASISSAYHRDNLVGIMESLPKTSLSKVINRARQLGYHIQSIENAKYDELHAVNLLIYLEYISLRSKPSLLLIDNLCEGVDYDRSVQLGRLLFSYCLKNDIQLIVSSNNTFLIDVLEMRYWNIWLRKDNGGLNNVSATVCGNKIVAHN